MNDWIFQENPKDFDIDGYLSAFDRVAWTIRQSHYKDQIEIGDRVFFWRSKGGQSGPYGVVAVGKIASKPTKMFDHPEALPYWRTNPEEEVALRCWINVTHCAIREGKLLPAEVIASDDVLRSLRILRLRQNTNYLIGADESNRLNDLYNKVIDHQESRVSSFSWTIESEDVAWKVLDKSAFIHWGTGIPIAIRSFFIEGEMAPGEKRNVTLLLKDSEYPAHIDLETPSTGRTRLFWNSEFSKAMKSSFPYHYQKYNQNHEPESKLIIRFYRLDGYKKYKVSFAGEVTEARAAKDVNAEEVEEKGPRLEGGVREYFGKRYERDPRNRREAIRYHGLACNVCGFNFEEAYGERGTGYIEVHHLKPISTFDEVQHVDPRTDLVTLCSNCHRMVHRKTDSILTHQELQKIIRR
ncbi:EVE domain-containing protein [Geomonas terrae]|uniref:EVE domain-containing protein n=1 Tax=Geomonas terrae TaxID=2562681 RepID=A0A4S1CDW1_9BACT|nr:EVE domain-containing protein [Geomonas terrae]TGU71629.1 EVE domain-containing protein [Geomonas terrae]